MFDLSSIVPELLKNIWKLLPFRFVIINEYQQGVFFRCGKAIRLCDVSSGIPFIYYRKKFPWLVFRRTGLHFHWAWIEDIPIITNVLQVMETQIQTISTKDDIDITVSFSISYEIFDSLLYWTKVQEFDSSLENYVQGIIGKTITSKDYSIVKSNSDRLCSTMQKKIQNKVEQWGVRIDAISIINLSKARPIRLLSSGTQYTSE